MDDCQLRCNHLKCRALVSQQAVVTTCSHLFCVDCANKLFGSERTCPACQTSLAEPDDVVITNLNPTEYVPVLRLMKRLQNGSAIFSDSQLERAFGTGSLGHHGNSVASTFLLDVPVGATNVEP
ncbi:hypothetical protein MRB53_039076 [Persea americana]|nr:hypothetical protein MRB53_039076 [Persea americana]